MEIYVKNSFISIFWFSNIIRCIDFTRIAASNTASDDVTHLVTHRILNTDILHSFAHFVVKFMKNSLNDGI